MAEVLHYINEHYPDELSLDLLSAKFFISKYHLSHEFHRLVEVPAYTGTSSRSALSSQNRCWRTAWRPRTYAAIAALGITPIYRAFKAEYHISPKQFLGRAGNEKYILEVDAKCLL